LIGLGMSLPSRKPETGASGQTVYHVLKGRAQGTSFSISYAAETPLMDSAAAAVIFAEVDRSLSLYLETSLINRFNRSLSGIRADSHMLRVVRKSQEVHGSSQGAFDITVKPLLDLFRSNPAATPREVEDIMVCIGSQRMRIRGDSLLKDCASLQMDCNGIAQGYTVDLLALRLESQGVRDYLVELGGEIRCLGRNPRGGPWVVGVEVPADDGNGHRIGRELRPDGASVTTSGNWHLRKASDGRPAVHMMDPRTGRPADNGMVSATVVADDAMTADALDNVCMVLGPEAGIRFIESIADAEAWLVYRDASGRLRDTSTSGFHRFEAR
jgi:thiamine biosynthesis lipoprotein